MNTNFYINQIKTNYARRERGAKATDEHKIKAFLGIIAGTMKASMRNIIEMFDMKKRTGVEPVYVTMSEQRFRFLMHCLNLMTFTLGISTSLWTNLQS